MCGTFLKVIPVWSVLKREEANFRAEHQVSKVRYVESCAKTQTQTNNVSQDLLVKHHGSQALQSSLTVLFRILSCFTRHFMHYQDWVDSLGKGVNAAPVHFSAIDADATTTSLGKVGADHIFWLFTSFRSLKRIFCSPRWRGVVVMYARAGASLKQLIPSFTRSQLERLQR